MLGPFARDKLVQRLYYKRARSGQYIGQLKLIIIFFLTILHPMRKKMWKLSINQNGRDDDEPIVWNNKNTTSWLVQVCSIQWFDRDDDGENPGKNQTIRLEIGKAMEAGQSSFVLNYCGEGRWTRRAANNEWGAVCRWWISFHFVFLFRYLEM